MLLIKHQLATLLPQFAHIVVWHIKQQNIDATDGKRSIIDTLHMCLETTPICWNSWFCQGICLLIYVFPQELVMTTTTTARVRGMTHSGSVGGLRLQVVQWVVSGES